MILSRRNFLIKSAQATTAIVVADKLDLLDRLFWKRKFFPGVDLSPVIPLKDTDYVTMLRAAERLHRGDLVYIDPRTGLVRRVGAAKVDIYGVVLAEPTRDDREMVIVKEDWKGKIWKTMNQLKT